MTNFILLGELQLLASQVASPLVEVPYFDTEVRTVYGLRAITNCIFPKKQT